MYDAVIPVPLQDGLALTQTTQIPHVEILGKRTDVKAYLDNPAYISSPCFNELIDRGAIQISSDMDGWLATHPDGLIVGHPWSNPSQKNLVVISESQETTNMAIFEWQKVYASFFNMEATANAIFDYTFSQYNCISSNAALVQSGSGNSRPSVVWAYWSTWAEAWDVAECENYYCEFARQCGADFIHSSDGSVVKWGYKYMSTAEFVAFARDADYWVYASNDWSNVYTDNYRNRAQLKAMKSVRTRQVYDTQGSGSNSWFEQRMAEPDVVLSDFCSMVGTETFDMGYQRSWLRNVFTEPVGFTSYCTNVNAPLVRNSATC